MKLSPSSFGPHRSALQRASSSYSSGVGEEDDWVRDLIPPGHVQVEIIERREGEWCPICLLPSATRASMITLLGGVPGLLTSVHLCRQCETGALLKYLDE